MAFAFPKLSLGVDEISYGTHRIVPLYSSPLRTIGGVLNVCSKCISIHPTKRSLEMHMAVCSVPFLPIYEENGQEAGGTAFKMSKISSLEKKQLLCLLARMFIKSKTAFYGVSNFDVFIVYDTEIMGYFSRPRGGDYSLSCLLVWPCFARQGLGSLLIDFSCVRPRGLSTARGPERPLSKKAIFCFRKYWRYKVIGAQTVRQISELTNLSVDDAIVGLELNGFDFKKWVQQGEIRPEKPRLLSKIVYCKNADDQGHSCE